MFLFIFQCLNEVVPKLLKELKEHRTPTSICADIDLCDGMFIMLIIYTPGIQKLFKQEFIKDIQHEYVIFTDIHRIANRFISKNDVNR